MYLRRTLWALCLPFIVLSCKDQPEAIPSYIHIQPFLVNAAGDASFQKITEGWLYVNGEFLGAYSLPATVPVLAEGNSEVQIFPGIKENGISATPNIYPILTKDVQQMDLAPGETRSITPSTHYDPAAIFPWALERTSFDNGSTIVLENRDGDPDNTFVLTSDGAFSGKCVLMRVTKDHPIMQIATETVELPATLEREVWLELNYKNDVPFYLYLIGDINGTENAVPVFQFNVRSEGGWNKIYLNISDALISLSQASSYRLLFNTGLPVDDSGNVKLDSADVRLDNMRLAHF